MLQSIVDEATNTWPAALWPRTCQFDFYLSFTRIPIAMRSWRCSAANTPPLFTSP
jgi:hypothetical protein